MSKLKLKLNFGQEDDEEGVQVSPNTRYRKRQTELLKQLPTFWAEDHSDGDSPAHCISLKIPQNPSPLRRYNSAERAKLEDVRPIQEAKTEALEQSPSAAHTTNKTMPGFVPSLYDDDISLGSQQLDDYDMHKDAARMLQAKIKEKIRDGQRRRNGQIYQHRLESDLVPMTDLKALIDQEGGSSSKDPNSKPASMDNQKLFKRFIIQQLRYTRLMRLLSLEKDRVQELQDSETKLKAFLWKDSKLLEDMKELIEDLRVNGENFDKGRLTKVNKTLDRRKKALVSISPMEPLSDSKDSSRSNTRMNSLAVTSRSKNEAKSKSELSTKNDLEGGEGEDQSRESRLGKSKLTMFSKNSALQSFIQSAAATSGVAPVLGRRRDLTQLKRTNPMIEITAKLRKALTKIKQTKSFIPLKMVLKSVTSFYADKIAGGRDNAIVREQDMMTFVYSTFLNTYGLSKFAESKFIKFMLSVKKYSSIERIGVFGRMSCIMEPDHNFTADESKQYLTGLEYLLTNQFVGMNVSNADYESRHYTSFARASEYARIFCEQRELGKELENLRQDMLKNKEIDKTNSSNKVGVIRVDYFLTKILLLHRVYKGKGKGHLLSIFDACNFDRNGVLSSDEFSVLVKNIEPERFDMNQIMDIYTANEEVLDSDNVGITFERFVTLSLENNYFQSEKQMKFIEATDHKDVISHFQSLKVTWPVKKIELRKILEANNSEQEAETIQFWEVAIGSMDEDMETKDEQCYLTALLKYKILIIEMNICFNSNVQFN